MSSRGYVLEQGMRDTRAALERWQSRPWPVLRGWLVWSLAVALGLLTAVWAVAALAPADPTPLSIPGLNSPATVADMGQILARNALVLALQVVTVLPHALLELVALFLPLAAWLVASRRDEWADLLAAAAVTVTVGLQKSAPSEHGVLGHRG